MARLLALTLALNCNAVLVLPPGWCCMLAPARAGQFKSCRCCCGCQSRPAPQPHEKPKPFDISKCCCADRHAANPHDQVLVLTPPAPSLRVVLIDARAAGPDLCLADRPSSRHPTALHVLDCIWLC